MFCKNIKIKWSKYHILCKYNIPVGMKIDMLHRCFATPLAVWIYI